MNTIRETIIIKFDIFTVSYTLNTVPESRFFFWRKVLYLYTIEVWTQVFYVRIMYVTVIVGFYKTRMTKKPFVWKQIWLSDRQKQHYKYPASWRKTHTHTHTLLIRYQQVQRSGESNKFPQIISCISALSRKHLNRLNILFINLASCNTMEENKACIGSKNTHLIRYFISKHQCP